MASTHGGHCVRRPAQHHAYINDTELFHSEDVEFAGPSTTLDAVPHSAVDTGLQERGLQLWVAPDASMISFQHSDRVEQWPALLSGCA